MKFITCPSCGEPQPPDNFHRDKSRPNGRGSICKECRAAADAAKYKEPIYAMTQAEVAKMLGMSRTMTAKVERQALDKARAVLVGMGFSINDLRA